MILPDFLSCFSLQLSVRNRCGGARPCGISGTCMGWFTRCDDANVMLKITQGLPFLPGLLPHAQNWRLTHHRKTLQSP